MTDFDPDAARGDSADHTAQDLQTSLRDLAGLVNGAFALEELLAQVATFAVHAIPGADGAGVTLLRADVAEGRVQALAASSDFVREIDAIQYDLLDEGPCISAAFERRTMCSGSLGAESRWPRFGPRVGRLGVHSVLSLPLMLPGQVVGAINAYARRRDAFDKRAAALGEQFAAPAAVAVHNARLLSQAQLLATQLQTALSSRAVIDQAIGILRSRNGSTAEESFDRLRTLSQAGNQKLGVVAAQVVEEAVRRARARHTRA